MCAKIREEKRGEVFNQYQLLGPYMDRSGKETKQRNYKCECLCPYEDRGLASLILVSGD